MHAHTYTHRKCAYSSVRRNTRLRTLRTQVQILLGTCTHTPHLSGLANKRQRRYSVLGGLAEWLLQHGANVSGIPAWVRVPHLPRSWIHCRGYIECNRTKTPLRLFASANLRSVIQYREVFIVVSRLMRRTPDRNRGGGRGMQVQALPECSLINAGGITDTSKPYLSAQAVAGRKDGAPATT